MTRLELTKADARRALVAFHFAQTDLAGAFHRLRSVQFDPLSPVGANHDLVLQARVKGYKVDDWKHAAYKDRTIFDGWDKQASLLPLEAWPLRRVFHDWHRPNFRKIFQDHPHAAEAVLRELESRGPMMPKHFDFQEHKEEWRGSWFGTNMTRQALRALFYTGQIMIVERRGMQHVYDLTERILPLHLLSTPKATLHEAVKEIVLERHLAVGLLRPTAPFEVWSFNKQGAAKKEAYEQYASSGALVPVEVDGVSFFASPELLSSLDRPLTKSVRFVAPLDQFMWDRRGIAHLFGFDYLWEVYVPGPKRRWGYYVLPVLYGDSVVARCEFWARKNVLEIRLWHWEDGKVAAGFWPQFEKALSRFKSYARADTVACSEQVDRRVREAAESL